MEGYTKLIVIVALALFAVASSTRNTAYAQQKFCNMNQDGFNACMPAVAGNDPPPPSNKCCDAVGGANLKCLCTFANSPILAAFNINKTAAMKLPVTCNVDPNFRCQGN